MTSCSVLLAITAKGLLQLISVVFLLLMVYSGYLNKLYAATVTLCITVFSVLVSLTFFQPLARVVMNTISWTEKVAYGMAMILLFLGTFVCCYALATARLPARLEGLPKTIAGVGGAVMGALTGIVFSGFMMVALYLYPLAGFEGQKEAFLGVDKVVLELAGVFHDRIAWQPFEPDRFLDWAKTVNAPAAKRPGPQPEQALPGFTAPPRR